ncbi:MAG TPA: hypothetical protein VN742_10810 [Candidatus Binataceae bacterium]|nr:hypothetical protein [Candidatus Binataceae bacterium]
MPELDKAKKLAERQRQRQRILLLLDTLPQFTVRSLVQVTHLRSRLLDVAETEQRTAIALLSKSKDRLKAIGEKTLNVQRCLETAAVNTDDVLAHPEKLGANLDSEEIDVALTQSLLSVERAHHDLQAQVLELDAIAEEADRLLNKQAIPS